MTASTSHLNKARIRGESANQSKRRRNPPHFDEIFQGKYFTVVVGYRFSLLVARSLLCRFDTLIDNKHE
jgi:hypothetical protein